jgi:hypothetical protein
MQHVPYRILLLERLFYQPEIPRSVTINPAQKLQTQFQDKNARRETGHLLLAALDEFDR